MSDSDNLEFKLNSSPCLKMCDITKRLFNRNFHSDVRFIVEDKTIFAHSLELMKRSVVFEQRFEHKLDGQHIIVIPIVDWTYDSFYQFIRFIYTDECDITKTNSIEILKLAIEYKVIMLENKVINYVTATIEGRLKLFDHCVVDCYPLVRNSIRHCIVDELSQHLRSKSFTALRLGAVYEILRFEQTRTSVTESDLFVALVKWITWYCTTRKISLMDGRLQFYNLIKMIRFPTMPIDDLRECAEKNPLLINKHDRSTIAWQILFGDSYSPIDVWISDARDEYTPPYVLCPFNRDQSMFETCLSISHDTILHGIRFGNCSCFDSQIEIIISTDCFKQLAFVFDGASWWDVTINFGDSLRLKAGCVYTISIKYLDTSDLNKLVLCRKEEVEAIINDGTKSVQIRYISCNMLEMFFESPSD